MNTPNQVKKKLNLLVLVVVGWMLALSGTARAQGTAFTYQGRLMESNAPANGTYEFEFSLYTAASAGTNLGVNTLEETPVSNGLFTVTLDFGSNVFNGEPRWLEMQVRNDNGGSFAVLSPRQPLTSAPYAITALTAGSAITADSAASANVASNLSGTLPTSQLSGTITSNQIANASIGSGKIFDGSILNADINNAAGIVDTKLATISTAGKVANSATTATSLNSSNTIVMRNGFGSFYANYIEATAFIGGGADIYGLDADNINYGTLDNSRLSSSVTLLGSTIEPSELSKPYQSGTIDSAKPETSFWRMSYPVTFSQPFASVPNVTLGLNTSDLSALDTLKVSVTSKSTTGFTASAIVPVPTASYLESYTEIDGGVSAISVNGNPGVFYFKDYSNIHSNETWFETLVGGTSWQQTLIISNTPLNLDGLSGAMIQGRPAFVFSESTANSIRYVRAANADGTAWGAPVTVVPVASSSAKPVLTEIAQRPAIVYISTNGHLKYVRANDSTGSSWGSGLTVDTNSIAWPFLTVINGNPAISCHRFNDGLIFHRASDTNGTTWATPVMVQANNPGFGGTNNGYYSRMTTVNGHPAIAYQRGPDTIMTRTAFIRANNANGTSWGTPHQLFPVSTRFGPQNLIVTDGRPAVCFGYSRSPRFIHAADANGDTWGPVIDLDTNLSSSDDNISDFNNISMVMCGGVPWVFYNVNNGSYKQLKYNRATVPDFQIDWTAIAP